MKILKLAMQTSVQDLTLDWTRVNLGEDSTATKKPTIIPQPIPPVFHGNRLVLYALFEDMVIVFILFGRVYLNATEFLVNLN